MSKFQIFVNSREIKYQNYEIELHLDKLINTMQIYTHDKDIKIGDFIYVATNKINPYLVFKVSKVINTISSNDISDILVIASSIEYDISRYYTKETIQFDINTSINKILSSYGFNNIGEDFNLVYTNELTIPIGTNLSSVIAKLLYEHGYFMSNASKYKVNIQKLDNHKTNYNLEFLEGLKEVKNKAFNGVAIYSDGNIRFDEKWLYYNSKIGDNYLVYKPLLNTNKASLEKIAKAIKLLELSKIREIEIKETTKNIYNLNDSINLAKIFNNINDSFYIYNIKYTKDIKTIIKLRKIIKG